MNKTMRRILSAALSLMLVLSVLFVSGTAVATAQAEGAKTTIKILTTRNNKTATNEAKDLWWFRYLEYWLNQQGYNVTLDVVQTMEPAQQLSLMLGTDTLPDLIWGIPLTAAQAVMYGVGEGMILDWTPYINEETMPNLVKMLEAEPDCLPAITCPDGKVYGLPYITSRGWGQGAGNMPFSFSMFWNKNWLEQVGVTELPTTLDGFVDVLRLFKSQIKLEDGKEVIPFVSHAVPGYLANYIWGAMGYYAGISSFGSEPTLKVGTGGELVIPATTEDYKTFISYMKTLYDEKLISEDYFTMDRTVAEGLMSDGVCGAVSHFTLGTWAPETYADWISMLPATTGDTPYVAGSISVPYINGGNPYMHWAAANTANADVLVAIMDYMYSDEGSTLYYIGPKQGEDPLNLVGGWYLDANGQPTVKEIEDGLYTSMELYGQAEIYSTDFVANKIAYTNYWKTLCGLDDTLKTEMVHDIITDEDFEILWKVDYTPDNADGWMRHAKVAAYGNNCTKIAFSIAFMSEEDAFTAAELKSVLGDYITTESTKFIVGLRPIEEIDAFQEELKRLNVAKYLELYQNAYSGFLDGIFGE